MLLNSSEYDIIFVNESWMHSDFSDSLMIPNSIYTVFRKDSSLINNNKVIRQYFQDLEFQQC